MALVVRWKFARYHRAGTAKTLVATEAVMPPIIARAIGT
jgi:hypothetical protein